MIEVNKDMYLLNPFLEKRLDLPPAICQKGVYFGKVILSTIPIPNNNAADCFVMIWYSFGKLDFCKVGDKSWRCIDTSILNPSRRHKSCLTDAIFFEDKFYLVSVYGEIYACDPNAKEPILSTHYERQNPSARIFWHLMESGGELFGIMHDFFRKPDEERVKHIESLSNEGREDIYNRFHEYHRCWSWYKTCSFEVYKLSVSGCNSRFIKVDNLDGKAAFLGRNNSFTISNPSVFGYHGNRIYFSDDRYRSYGMNVFNMEDGVFKPLYLTNSQLPKAPPIWVSPQP
ncbi:hypothetical protein HS088_TW08G00847 [Tripterygium wilfordii]|uniref:KIB1-4 beta-propeller domain-containing protein n=1 Tax=Tripterygium wilfordii TaxID=458696 RepID=A0A7J7DDB8_TRIWF|nr:hypothetical protein HS088_TW08G00847 [Tripterygium wilfordii]